MSKKEQTLLGFFVALIIVMTFVPYTGFISIGSGIAITTLHIVLIIGAITLRVRGGLIIGIAFGLSSLARVYLLTPSPFEFEIFSNPLVSVLPRIVAGVIISMIYIVAVKLTKNMTLAVILTAILGTLVHTSLVITALNTFEKATILATTGKLFDLVKIIIAINGLLEIGLAVIVVPPIVFALRKAGFLINKEKN